MADKSFHSANAFINAIRGTPFSVSALWAALYTTMPTKAGGGVEVSGGAYERQTLTLIPPDDGESANSTELLYPEATADWGEILGFGVLDADSNGNLLAFDLLRDSEGTPYTVTISTGSVFRFKPGALKWQES